MYSAVLPPYLMVFFRDVMQTNPALEFFGGSILRALPLSLVRDEDVGGGEDD